VCSDGSAFVSALHQKVAEAGSGSDSGSLRRRVLQGGFSLMKYKNVWHTAAYEDKIFLSATLSESRAELDVLLKKCLPQLRRVYQAKGINISAVCLDYGFENGARPCWEDFTTALTDCCGRSVSLAFVTCVADE
jgi:hypothetical protein